MTLTKTLFQFVQKERIFLMIIGLLFMASFIAPIPNLARWLGFLIAGYAAVANDSIQTIGTFIASNRHRPWWLLWAFIGGIFIVTTAYSWVAYSGDVSYGRLASKGFSETPAAFSYLQIAAPIFLLILTRLKMPVSTTFLILTAFSTSSKSVANVLIKSLTGYGLAFVIAFVSWLLVSRLIQRFSKNTPHPYWFVAQWLSTGVLWSVWLMQDAANIAVYLPRQLSASEFLFFAIPIVLGLGFMLFKGGAKIQQVVEEKSRVSDVRSATLVDFIYAIILFYFKLHSKIPMSTTWVFLGLLAGREIAMSIKKTSNQSMESAIRMSLKDAIMALIGLAVSFGIAIGCNDAMRQALLGS
ncbi:MAG: hypothetical protein ISQ13_01065 [Candidatus Margulisbacteria bacterium]|nr:hypothetical protein [Candidatus Margulisiibacteriota bacterium]